MSRLARVLEAEVMDTEEEAVSYDEMDHSEVNRLFLDRFVELGGSGRVLDIGTGPVQMPVELARRLSAARVVGIDAAGEMLRIGAEHVRAAGFGARIDLLRTDAKRLPFGDQSFDAVFSNSIVHHLPDPLPCLREIARVVRPGGAILLRDLHRPDTREELDQLVATYAADCDERQRGLFRDSLHASFTIDELVEMLGSAGLGDLQVYKNSDRHWTAERQASPAQA